MSLVNILIVEDESIIGTDIVSRLEKMGYEAVHAKNVTLALEILDTKSIDIAILDIDLGNKYDGVILAEIINQKFKIPFVFLSSHDDPLTLEKAGKVSPNAYLLKPFNDRSIRVTIELALNNYQSGESDTGDPNKPEKEGSILLMNDSLFLKKNHHYERVLLSHIILLEAESNYTTIHTDSGSFVYSVVLGKMEAKLHSNNFKRIHRSYVVNLDRVTGFDGNQLHFGERKIPVSRQYRNEIFKNLRIL